MTDNLPPALVGTTRVTREARAGFGEFLDKAVTGGRGTLLTEGGSWVWETLRADGRRSQWDVWGLVPHVSGYVREVTDYGVLGAGWRRLRQINVLSAGRLFFLGLFNARGVLRRHFPTLLTLLLELEMATFRKYRPPVMFLHPQMTDLLLAMDHGGAMQRAVDRIRRGSGAAPGLATYNLGTLLPRLKSWGLEVPYVMSSVHPLGYGMRPNREACETALRGFGGRLIATCETGLDEDVSAYWREQGVAAGVYDVPEHSGTEWRLWQSWRDRADAPRSGGEAGAILAGRDGGSVR
jgi:hypothetical protein